MEGRIKIGDDPIIQLESIGMYIVDSDKIFSSPQMDYEIQNYPELGKSIIYPVTYDKPFEYEIKIGVIGNINERINSLSQYSRGKIIEIYNDYTKIKIVGFIKSISKADKFNRNKDFGAATFSMIITVNNPSLCDFEL